MAMSYKDKFDKALLHTKTNAVGTHHWRGLSNQYEDARLNLIRGIVDSGLHLIKRVSFCGESKESLFRTRIDSNPLGMVISIDATGGASIQFACPRGDQKTLLVSVLPNTYNRDHKSGMHPAQIYDYTGNIDAANELLINWLAEIAPDYKAQIGHILESLDVSDARRYTLQAQSPVPSKL